MTEAEIAKQAAQAAAEGPFVWSNLVPTAWMFVVAMAGGAVSFYQKVRTGKVRAFNVAELAGELLVSGLVGLFTYWVCHAFKVDPYLTAAGVGIAGHMGTRALFLAEQWLEKKAK